MHLLHPSRRLLPTLTLLGTLALAAPAARATNWYVATTGSDTGPGTAVQPFRTIQEGVNASQTGDTVYVADGTYAGPGNHDIEFTQIITLMGDAAHPENCVLDLGGSPTAPARACQFYHQETPAMVFAGFTVQGGYRAEVGGAINIEQSSSPTIQNCIFRNNTAGRYGGAVYMESGSQPLLQDCTFSGNTAPNGGAVYADPGFYYSSTLLAAIPTVSNCLFTGNIATAGSGGGLSVQGNGSSATVSGCAFTGNAALGTSAEGGGLFADGSTSVTISGCTFMGNTVAGSAAAALGSGGGAGLALTSVRSGVVSDCAFTNNTVQGAYGEGAGVDMNGSSASFLRCSFTGNDVTDVVPPAPYPSSIAGAALLARSGALSMVDCILTGNQMESDFGDVRGGVLDLVDTGAVLTGCVIAGNTATAETMVLGGAVRLTGSGEALNTILTNCTVTMNQFTAPTIQGIALDAESANADMTVVNSIVYNNTGSDPSAVGIEAYLGADAPNVTCTDVGGGYAGTGNINANPQFVGAPSNLRLQPGSPCIGAGTTNAPNYLPTDITGATYANPPSIGAYEGAFVTQTNLTSSLNPSGIGQSVTFTTTVSNTTANGPTPTGSVQFSVDGVSAGGPVALSGGTARFSTSGLSAGSHSVTAQYAPAVGFAGSSATLTQTVFAAPTANSQTVSVVFNTAKAITLSGTDPNNPSQPLTYQVTAQPQHGTLSGAAPNVTYTPNANFQGADSFTFTVNNGVSASAPATVSLMVVPGTPTANGQSVSIAFNTAKAIALTGSDPDMPTLGLTYAVATSPSHGTLSGLNASTGAVTYTPTAGYQGGDSFTFTVSNSVNTSAPATVTLTVAAGTPTANSQSVSVGFNTAKAVTLTGSDPDVPALPLTYAITSSPTHGTLSGTAPNLTYTPTAGYHGGDAFTFTVSNGINASTPATVTLTIAAGVPTANAQSISTATNTAKAITLTGSDPDVPSLTLTYAIASAPTHGTLSGFNAATGAVTYTPAAGYAGPDSFTFTVNNGKNTSAPATVSVTVLPALTTLLVSPASITGGYGVTGTVSLNGPAAADSVVTLTDNSASVTTPATVTIKAGQTSATFPITTKAVTATTTVTLTAFLSGVTQTATLTLTPAPSLAGLSVSPSLVTSGTNATGTVTLTAPAAPGGFTVSLSTLPFSLAGVPSSVVVPQGQTSATFTVSTQAFLLPYTVQVFASSGFQVYSALLTAIPPAHLLAVGVGLAVQGGASTTGTVTLSGVTATPITVTLSATGPASVPGSVTVPAGSCSATFPVNTTAVSKTTSATVTATYGGSTQSQTLIVIH